MRALALPLVLLTAFVIGDRRAHAPPRVVINDNRAAGGSLRGGTLTLRLEARLAEWHPDGDSAPGAVVPAFAEASGAARIPGPLVRVPAGTEVVVTVRNALPDTLEVHGLHDRPLVTYAAAGAPPLVVPPGATRSARFRLGNAGTYYYWGSTMHRTVEERSREDAQLGGAIVVDEPGRVTRDRILVLGVWSDTSGRALTPRSRILATINGRSWPHTERMDYTTGDTVRWRVINASADSHPMHLHGFYFRVDSRGDGVGDTTFADSMRPSGVTSNMVPGSTLRLTWVPDRPGNWLFHCHLTEHFGPRGSLGMARPANAMAMHDAGHANSAMNGLVLGVRVHARPGAPARVAADGPRRSLRLVVQPDPTRTGDAPLYSYAIDAGGGAPEAGTRVAPAIVLRRGEPVAITVVNHLAGATSVHWHGIELESYYDGVPGFSGDGSRLAPLIAPGDSFEARFTPPRAGTFIYHTHADEERQQRGGLAGPLIVLEPDARWNPETDRAVMITTPLAMQDEVRAVLLDGSMTPPPMMLRAGVTYRLRFVNMTLRRPGISVGIWRDTTLATWRPLAKDGADLPPGRRRPRPARAPISIGETVDVELTPDSAQPLWLEVRTPQGVVLAKRAMVVQP